MKLSSRILNNKPALYFIILLTFFISLEVTIRFNETSVFSLQQKILVKLQMFMLRDQTDILFLGSSRTQDGIEPEVIIQKLSTLQPELKNLKAFNGGSAKASLKRLAYVADRAMDKPGLKILAIEVSKPQLSEKDWSPSYLSDTPVKDTESFLQQMLSKYSYTIRYRDAFRLKSLSRVPLLLMANSSDGTEWFRRAALKQRFAETHTELSTEDNINWKTEIIRPNQPLTDNSELVENSKTYFQTYQKIADKARSKSIQLVLYVPPISGEKMTEECNQKYLNTYQQLSARTSAPLLLHSCKKLRSVFFYKNDTSHLNRIGRTQWSGIFAESILHSVLTNPDTQIHQLAKKQSGDVSQ